jgi:diguanylate cyclase (GGDEF)-like protein/PAS domain S-box-containing protein
MNTEDLKWMINLIPDAAMLVNRHQNIVAVNLKAAGIFRTTVEDLLDAPLDILIPESSLNVHRNHVDSFLNQQKPRPMGAGLRLNGKRSDGSEIPVDIMINRIRYESMDYGIAIVRDDSEKAEIEVMKEKLQSANARLTRAQEVGGVAWWESDLGTGQLLWSSMLPRILGLQQNEQPSFRAIRDVCLPEDRDQLGAIHDHLGAMAGKTVRYRIQRPDGEIRWIEETCHQEAGDLVMGVLRDITGQKNLEEKLRKESVTDELTGLFNRKQFNRDLKSAYSAFVRSGNNSAILTYDFDHFKNINDLYGHAMGDEVLRLAASLVKNQLRPSDHAYRLGGEEFAILLGDTSLRNARNLAERIRKTIHAARFRVGDVRACATISLGIAQFRTSDSCFEDALKRTDEALYQSKTISRNVTSIYE